MHAVYRIVSPGRDRVETVICERITRRLIARGAKVAVIKHVEHDIDVGGKNSWRYREAGAHHIVLSSKEEVVTIIPSALGILENILSLIPPHIFIVLVEGYRESRVGKKVVVADSIEEYKELSSGEVLAVVTSNGEVREAAEKYGARVFSFSEASEVAREIWVDALNIVYSNLPGANCNVCGLGTCKIFAENVLRGEVTLGECPIKSKIYLSIDGRVVAINPYTKRVLRDVVVALVKTLKGVPDKPRSIQLSIDLSP